jgi:hypothetical protein
MTSPIINLPRQSYNFHQTTHHIRNFITIAHTSNMFSQAQSPPASAPTNTNQHNFPTTADSKGAIAGSNFAKGLERLTRVLERRVDRQIMTAQIRAYDCPADLLEKPRYM